MVTCGGVVSRLTVMLAVPVKLPTVAVAVRMFGPSASGTWTLKRPLATGAGIPLMVTVAAGSLTVPLTVVGLRLR